MRTLSLILLWQLCIVNSPVYAGATVSFDLKQLTLTKENTSQQIAVNDPVYKAKKNYLAFPLQTLLKQLKKPDGIADRDLLVVFTAEDGYKAFLNYQDAFKEKGYLAYRDQNAANGKDWVPFKFGKETITPGPFYLVWPKPGLNKWQYPWPFQVTSIALQSNQNYFGQAAPKKGDVKVKHGFSYFSRYCIRCHAINHSGGTLAPDLNVPINVTQMYDDNYLHQFILDAPSFKPETKMPRFEGVLNRQQIQAILDYLKQKKLEQVK